MTEEPDYTANSNELKENCKMPLTMTIWKNDLEWHVKALTNAGIQNITTEIVRGEDGFPVCPITVDVKFKATQLEYQEYKRSLHS
jgi:hypothetical protein